MKKLPDTDLKVKVTNGKFIETIFDQAMAEPEAWGYPVTSEVVGDPTRAAYPVRPVTNTERLDHARCAELNGYFSVATFDRSDDGEVARRKGQFHALFVVAVDDVGRPECKLPPTWVLETSRLGFHRYPKKTQGHCDCSCGVIRHWRPPLTDGRIRGRI